jgi:hypothetical protein
MTAATCAEQEFFTITLEKVYKNGSSMLDYARPRS